VKAALLRAAAGTPTRLPMWVITHLVAARYGTSPRAVREEWGAADVLEAAALLEFTAPIRSSDE
jgi:hypothetical protein